MGIILRAFLSPEISAIHWVRTHGVSRSLLWDWLGKWAILIMLGLAFGYRFLFFWLFLRLIYGLGDLVFFRIVHHRQGEYGTFSIPLAPWLTTLAGTIAGSTVVQATIHHDVHQNYASVAVEHLATVRALQTEEY
ncbi:MAG: hypothetical protein QNJ46_31935 [Leptolyngbyaceae cyanobacterium MO_188.B28]|nr:hypothetical protein [Leptolyngbyaceae cyanobacterium MO_188.B28]